MPLRGRADARYGGAESPGRPSREHVGPGKADTAPEAPRPPEGVRAARLALSRMTPDDAGCRRARRAFGVMPRKPSGPGATASAQIVRRSGPADAAAVSAGCR